MVAAGGVRDKQPPHLLLHFALSVGVVDMVLDPVSPSSGCATLFLRHLPSQSPMISTGSGSGGGCG